MSCDISIMLAHYGSTEGGLWSHTRWGQNQSIAGSGNLNFSWKFPEFLFKIIF